MNYLRKLVTVVRKREAGFTLLEYVTGATVLVIGVWLSLQGLADNMEEMLSSIGDWMSQRATDIQELDS